MASDVEDLTTFYDNLPSIFENNPSACLEQSYNPVITNVNREQSYQPMFGSFVFTDSDPLSRAAFVASSSPSTETHTIDEQITNDEHDSSSRLPITSSLSPQASRDDIDDDDDENNNNTDEDDFDGIPIRHSSVMMKRKLNGDSDSIVNHSEHDHLFDEFVHHLENSHDDNEIEDDAFLNGFTDEQHDTIAIVPSLFKDIPDIDDLNEHDEDNDDGDENGRVPFDQSDSIRSSSPDSLLSSSHLQDDQDDDLDMDHEVAQWNDDLILNVNLPSNRANSPLITNIHPFNQVDFIDSSRSNSRCSNVSSHLSIGYADQAHTFMSDDVLKSSSDSSVAADDDENQQNIMHVDCDSFDRDDSEELCLQVNLDDRHATSSLHNSNSTHSSLSSSIPEEIPIVDMDEDNEELKTLQVAPIAALDDEDDNEDDALQTYTSQQPILSIFTSSIKNPIELKTESIRDTINMRHLLNENDQNDDDDEFTAVMHNPRIFEQVSYNNGDDHEKKSDLIKQTNSVTSTFRPSSQLSIDNKIEKESFEHFHNIHQTYSLLEANGEKTRTSSSSQYTRKTATPTPITNNSSPTAVNHLTRNDEEGKENDGSSSVDDSVGTLYIKQKKQYLTSQQRNTSNIDVKQFAHSEKHNHIMSTDNESDDEDDLELLQTLSQLHGIIHTTHSSEENNQLESHPSIYASSKEKNDSPDTSSCHNAVMNEDEMKLLKMKNQNSRHIIPASSYIIDTIIKTNDEQEEKNEKKNVIFLHQNLNDDDVSNASTSPILFNDDSHSSVVIVDPDTSFSLPNLLLTKEINDLTLSTNQTIADDLQISKTQSNMNDLPNNDLPDQMTSNLFDPFAPSTTTTTTTTTKTGMFDDDVLTNSKDFDMRPELTSTQPLANYNFDDLWNQSISHITSSNHHESPTNAFAWDAFVNNNEKTNPFDDNTTSVPTANSTWDSLFNEEQQEDTKNDLRDFLHWIISRLDASAPRIEFASIHNLESIVKDIHMSVLPFEPIPSPPLHVDHTVANPLINATHHELFPIDELEQPNVNQGQQSMTLYEEDEDEVDDNQTNQLTFVENSVKPVAQNLVSNVLQKALTEVDEPNSQVEHFVDQILAQAIFDVYNEEKTTPESETNDTIPIENLASIISWHDQTKATTKQLPDPFDQKFDSVWSSHFQAPDDTTNENFFENEHDHETKDDVDPWLMTTMEPKNNPDPANFFSKTLADTDLFSSTKNVTETEDDETGTLSEYVPPALLADPANTTSANNLMKYTITASVMDDSGDDTSAIEDYLPSRKTESSATTTKNPVNQEPLETDDITLRDQKEIETDDHFFSNNARLSQFEVFASNQPLNLPEIESKFSNITAQFDNEFSPLQPSNDDNAPWVSVDTVKSSGIGDSEPWELEDHGDDKISPVPTTTRLSTFNDNAFPSTDKSDVQRNFFSDSFASFVPSETHANDNKDKNNGQHFTRQQSDEDIDQSLTKNVRFNEHIQKIRAATPPIDTLEESKASTTSDSDDVEIDDIKPSFEIIGDRITDHTNASYVKPEHPYESAELPLPSVTTRFESKTMPSPFKDKTNTLDDNIPLKSAVILPNTNTQSKANIRSESEMTPTIQTTTTTTNNTKIRSSTDTQSVQPLDSALLRSTSKDESGVDTDEVDDVISCVIDNTPVNIDAKTITPFKCVISSAGTLQEDNQTAIIAIYGCWLPDHRLREYRYIMDQLFYYVYHKLDKLVINDYILIYFHGATPKHRTPDMKFLRKCYQMINFRLRKNLRAVYVVHPTRWLRTVVALSRPFFSNKFYHKVHYVYTIAELERQFPNNRLSIPVAIEQTDWLYSQKYDRQNASIKRSIAQSISRSPTSNEDESTA